MGTVRKQEGKKKTTYLARVRRGGLTDTATFDLESDAKNWITQQESNIITGKPVDISKFKKYSLVEIFQDYIENGKQSQAKNEMLERLQRLLPDIRLGGFTAGSFEIFIDQMLNMDVPRPEHWKKPHPNFNGSMVEVDGKLQRRKVAPSTVRKYYYCIRTALFWHAKKYNYHFDNKPFEDNKPPKAWNPRTRVLEEDKDELNKILLACDKMYKNQEVLKEIILFQLNSAMRMGETLKMKFKDIFYFEDEPWKSYVFVPKEHQKSRAHESCEDRYVNMTPELIEVIKLILKRKKTDDNLLVFPFWKDSKTLSQRFRVIWKNAGLTNIKAHDFRHVGVTKFFDTDLTDIEISKITAHAYLNTLKRYHNQDVEAVGLKMWRKNKAP